MREAIHALLEPCLVEAPTTGAAILLVEPESASYTLINMSALEAVHIMRFTADTIESRLGAPPEVLQ
jgi:hypothetical protein